MMREVIKILAVCVASLAIALAVAGGCLWGMLTAPLHFLFACLVVAVIALACNIGVGIFTVLGWLRPTPEAKEGT